MEKNRVCIATKISTIEKPRRKTVQSCNEDSTKIEELQSRTNTKTQNTEKHKRREEAQRNCEGNEQKKRKKDSPSLSPANPVSSSTRFMSIICSSVFLRWKELKETNRTKVAQGENRRRKSQAREEATQRQRHGGDRRQRAKVNRQEIQDRREELSLFPIASAEAHGTQKRKGKIGSFWPCSLRFFCSCDSSCLE